MAERRYDVLGIGNALVDILARTDEAFLLAHGVAKGSMQLVDERQADALYAAIGATTTVSGGSAANTIAGVAALGGRGALIARVRDDALGATFAHDLRALGVAFSPAPAASGPGTGRCIVLVTPDGERSMSTYLGAGQDLAPDDLDEAMIAAAHIVYLEGYLWDPPQAKAAFLKAAEIAHANGGRVAITLSDAFCVDRYRAEFNELIDRGTVDIVFANESEIRCLYETSSFDTAVDQLAQRAVLGVVTRSEQGCVVLDRGDRVYAPAEPVCKLVDTTGAGDLFAAGFLFGLAQNRPLEVCARLGAIAAAEVIQHMGARPQSDLRQLVIQSGLAL
ncbi:adenosine kinase [Camelimonas abortus]|uniref:Adenosine kinase n=1 Tax=Camelimonas abortus TaxID=1017184 RepID=A0ABV7LD98_9HYPH